MNIFKIYALLFALTSLCPLAAESHLSAKTKFSDLKSMLGLRLGSAGLEGNSTTLFLETRHNNRYGLRYGLEYTGGYEEFDSKKYPPYAQASAAIVRSGFPGVAPDVRVDRFGATIEGLCYFPGHNRRGPKFYFLAGAGCFRTKMSTRLYYSGGGDDRQRESKIAPSFSVGIGGRYSRFIGIELRHSQSFFKSPFGSNIGEQWVSFSLISRIPLYR